MLIKNRKEGNRFTASRRASGERPGTSPLGERTLSKFGHLLRENRYYFTPSESVRSRVVRAPLSDVT